MSSTVIPAAGAVVGSAMSVWDAANEQRSRLASGRGLEMPDSKKYAKKADKYARQASGFLAAKLDRAAPKKKGIGAGGVIAIILGVAAARGLPIEIKERPAAKSLPEAAEILGIPPSGIVKTLVVKRSDDTFLFALIPGDRAISWPKLRAVVGVNKLQLPDPERALAATGYERGTIVPIGSTNDWPIYADSGRVGRRVAMGAGAHGYTLFVEADDLIAAYGATVADISQPLE